jgi:hypothetical protein
MRQYVRRDYINHERTQEYGPRDEISPKFSKMRSNSIDLSCNVLLICAETALKKLCSARMFGVLKFY